jgi:hypothetical protein
MSRKVLCHIVQDQEGQPKLMTEEQEKIFLKRFNQGTRTSEKYRGLLWPGDRRGPRVNPLKLIRQSCCPGTECSTGYNYLIRNPYPVIYQDCRDSELITGSNNEVPPSETPVTPQHADASFANTLRKCQYYARNHNDWTWRSCTEHGIESRYIASLPTTLPEPDGKPEFEKKPPETSFPSQCSSCSRLC